MRKLLPPKNYREVYPRTCINCDYFKSEELNPIDAETIDYYCLRSPSAMTGEWNAWEPYRKVCDGFKRTQ